VTFIGVEMNVRFFKENEDFNNRLVELAKEKPTSVLIGSYSIYAGILKDGRDTTEWDDAKYGNLIHEFLDELDRNNCDTKILIGVPHFPTCYKGCPNCRYKKVSLLKRLYFTAKKWDNFDWKFHDSSHLKCVLFSFEDGRRVSVMGGRNLSCSTWEDFSLEFAGHPKELIDAFGTAWDSGYPSEELKGKAKDD
jgi:hypothetical protein